MPLFWLNICLLLLICFTLGWHCNWVKTHLPQYSTVQGHFAPYYFSLACKWLTSLGILRMEAVWDWLTIGENEGQHLPGSSILIWQKSEKKKKNITQWLARKSCLRQKKRKEIVHTTNSAGILLSFIQNLYISAGGENHKCFSFASFSVQ